MKNQTKFGEKKQKKNRNKKNKKSDNESTKVINKKIRRKSEI